MTAGGRTRHVAKPGTLNHVRRATEAEARAMIRAESRALAARSSEVKSIRVEPTIPEGTREMNRAAWKNYWQQRRAWENEQDRRRRMIEALREKEIRDLYENPPEIIHQCYTWTDGYYRCILTHQHDGDHDYGSRA